MVERLGLENNQVLEGENGDGALAHSLSLRLWDRGRDREMGETRRTSAVSGCLRYVRWIRLSATMIDSIPTIQLNRPKQNRTTLTEKFSNTTPTFTISPPPA